MPKKTAKTEDFLTFSNSSDFKPNKPRQERNLAEEIHKTNWQTEKIDMFEKSLGIRTPQKKKNLRTKFRLFAPEFEKDSKLLEELANNPKYTVTTWDKNWDMNGNIKIFVSYTEDLDYKEPEQVIQDIAEGKNT